MSNVARSATEHSIDVSIVTVVFNGMATLDHLLRGTADLLRRFPNLEHVIVDGQSSDGSCQRLAEYAATCSRIHYISEKDRGIYDAMNKGVRLSRGHYFIHLNADDGVLNPEQWSIAMGVMKQRNVDVLATDVPIVSQGKVLRYIPGRPISVLHRYLGHHFPHQGTFFSVKLFQELGGYCTEIGYVADKVFCYQVWDVADPKKIAFGNFPISYQSAGGVSSKSLITPWKTTWLVLQSRKFAPHRFAILRALANPFFKVYMLVRSPRLREYQILFDRGSESVVARAK